MNLDFRIETDRLDDGLLVLAVHGELDQATVPTLHATADPLVDEGEGSLLVDLSGCGFIDSSGLAAFVAMRERVTATPGREFALCNPESQVRRLFELTGLDTAMSLLDSRDAALAYLRDGSPEPA